MGRFIGSRKGMMRICEYFFLRFGLGRFGAGWKGGFFGTCGKKAGLMCCVCG